MNHQQEKNTKTIFFGLQNSCHYYNFIGFHRSNLITSKENPHLKIYITFFKRYISGKNILNELGNKNKTKTS